MQQQFIADVLLWKSINRFSGYKFVHKEPSRQGYPTKYRSELNTPDLVELLQKSAVEHLTTYRQLEAREFEQYSEYAVVTTDFEALYAYKRGDYQQCLQLSTEKVDKVLYTDYMFRVDAFPEFIQLLDDDIVSLTALMLIVNPRCRYECNGCESIDQSTLSLYLITQCKLKLRHSLTSLADTLSDILFAVGRYPVEWILNRLILKMIAHKALTYMTTK